MYLYKRNLILVMAYYKIWKIELFLSVCTVYQMQLTRIRFSIKTFFCVAVFHKDGYYYLPKHAAKLIMYVSTKKSTIIWKELYFYIISRVYAHIIDVNCFESFGNALLKIHNVMGKKKHAWDLLVLHEIFRR